MTAEAYAQFVVEAADLGRADAAEWLAEGTPRHQLVARAIEACGDAKLPMMPAAHYVGAVREFAERLYARAEA